MSRSLGRVCIKLLFAWEFLWAGEASGLRAMSRFGGVIRSAVCAVDEKTVHLIIIGVKQDRAAVSANEVYRVGAGNENRRSV
jgi:hypothetical protein